MTIEQRKTADIPSDNWDVIVVGAGPAGATCALWLARSGLRVLLLDKDRFPRSKSCGDLLIPDAISELKRSGLFDAIVSQGKPMSVIRIYSPSRVDFGVEGSYIGIARSRLDTMLAQGAVAEGAVWAEGEVVDIGNTPDSPAVRVRALTAPLCPRYVVLATGANITLAERLGMIGRKEPSAVALRCYVKSTYRLEEVVITYDRSLLPGYAWIMPLEDNVYNVGCGVTADAGTEAMRSLKKRLRLFQRTFPVARDLMSQAERVSAIQGAALRYGLEGIASPVQDRVVAIGEVIGTTFPFTGEGIGKAMHSGRLAAESLIEAITRNDPSTLSRYPREIDRQLAPAYRGYAVAQRWLSQPWLNDFMARRIKKSRYLQQQAKAVMAETGDPRKLYAPGSVIRSFFH